MHSLVRSLGPYHHKIWLFYLWMGLGGVIPALGQTPDDLASAQVIPIPENTKISSSFGTDKDKTPANLFDGNPETIMIGVGNSCPSPTTPTSIYLKFPTPVKEVGGIETGNSDPFANYYPIELEFWADSDGDGRFDTKLGSTRKLGPNKQSAGRHLFEGRLEQIYGLEIRAVEQSARGAKRSFQMDEMHLLRSTIPPIIASTPNSYRILYVKQPVPEGSTARVTFETEDGKGAESLLDNDPTTFINSKQGTAKEGKAESIFLRFPKPVTDLAGIVIGKSDPFANYVWQEMEIYADTAGKGTYDTLAAKLSGATDGERRFFKTIPTTYGLELRVTKQTLKGSMRCFMLNGIDGLVFKDDPGDEEMHYVVESFEDFSSWRTWANNTAQPEGERYYGGYTYLCGVYDPKLAKDGEGVGKMRYCFKDTKEAKTMWAARGRVRTQEALLNAIEFWANPQGYPCTISFEMLDARGRKFRTPGVKVEGAEWKSYSIEVNPTTIPKLADFDYPFKMQYIWLSSDQGGTGDVLLDNIAYKGVVDRSQRLQIKRVYEGLSYEPDKNLVVKYRLWNALPKEVKIPLEAKLYSSFDPKHTNPVSTKTVEVSVPAAGDTVCTVDFGKTPYGHYQSVVSVATEKISTSITDPIAVLKLNGGRINKGPMWFGGTHPGSWIAAPENAFVMRNVVVPLGLDAYRTGAPDKDVMDAGLLCAAGFGDMPPNLRLPNQKNETRGEPNDYDAYAAWVKEEARSKYLPYADKILAIEYYNEPDLPNFCYLPEIDTFLKMHRSFAKAFREVIPGIRIGTGGNTVEHAKAKTDFNPRMYTELAKEADVAIWHAHGPLDNYTQRQQMVEGWLGKGGKPKSEMLLGNTEAGIPSGESPIGWLTQADTLVKKIGWAKSQPSSLFYIWFTTTDTYDPQGGYLDNENWGLVTYNQRLKPSGQAYNELIRQLSNTKGLGETELNSRLQTCSYLRADGSRVFLTWPRQQGAKFIQPLAATGPVTVTDMFGHSEQLTPKGGKIDVALNGYPTYLSMAKGVQISAAKTSDYAQYEESLAGNPGTTNMLPVTFKNIWKKPVTLSVVLFDENEKNLHQSQVSLAAGASQDLQIPVALPPKISWGLHGYSLKVSSSEAELNNDVLPVAVMVAQMIPKGGPFEMDGVIDKTSDKGLIVLDKVEDMQDLAFDPTIPLWQGPDDLSLRARFAHDEKGIYVGFDVKDQTHKTSTADAKLWTADSIQISFSAEGKTTQIGLSEVEGGTGWCWASPNTELVGKKLTLPFKVKRESDHTLYEVYLPFKDLGFEPKQGADLRCTFLINEDDGRGRVRIMKWFDGIATGGSVDKFGHMILE